MLLLNCGCPRFSRYDDIEDLQIKENMTREEFRKEYGAFMDIYER